MTPTAFRAALAASGDTQAGFARQWGIKDRQVRRWASGTTPVPRWVALVLGLLDVPGVRERLRAAS